MANQADLIFKCVHRVRSEGGALAVARRPVLGPPWLLLWLLLGCCWAVAGLLLVCCWVVAGLLLGCCSVVDYVLLGGLGAGGI